MARDVITGASESGVSVTLLHLIVVALVQGITEYLPISSSAHLVLIPALTDWPDQGARIDVAAHVGSLGAVLVYFRADVAALVRGALSLARRRADPGRRLFVLLVLATVPAVVAGAVVVKLVPGGIRGLEVIAWTMTVGAVLLYLADRFGPRVNDVAAMTARQAFAIGLAQALALVPGTSRAGITMTAARMFGFTRPEAARFSMLMSIPIILAAGALSGLELVAAGDALITGDALIVAALAFFAALASIAVLMRWLRHASFTPLVIYRLVLGGALLWLVYA